ncbi:MAG: MFS transporter [Burkholderiaceae bacterium]|jgi:MFS family permease|nr:MFS transporter [Burkholderiaceae bacterium]
MKPTAPSSASSDAPPPFQDETGAHSQFELLRKRRFWPLFVTQFLGAFNDNVYKNALVVLLTFSAASWTTMKPEVLTNLAAGLFMLPFFLFSATAGQLADKFDKARLARWAKALEIVIILVAALGFWLHNLPWLLTALFLLGLQAALFGPVKYAILPQHLQPQELVGGNAMVEAGTFTAILLGTLGGGLLAGLHDGIAWIVGICIVVALAGFWASCHIPAAPAPMPKLKIAFNPLSEIWRCIGFARQERSVFLSVLGISWFWLYGAVLLAQFPVYTKTVLGGDESMVTLLLAMFCVGIGVGSLLCEKLSHRRGKLIELGLVPMGALGMAIFGIDLAFAAPARPSGIAMPLAELLHHGSTWRVLFDLLMLSAFGGLYCVPLYALVQQRSNVAYRARVIAANNILNALFMVTGALAAAAFLGLGHVTLSILFLCMAIVHAGVMIYIFSVAPEFLRRALVWLGLRRE